MRWATEVRLAEKLRTMRIARAEDGESFAVLTSNSRLLTPIKLDLRLIEADQVATPDLLGIESDRIDGIVFDSAGNPIVYHVLKNHPGDAQMWVGPGYDRIPAAAMIHLYRCDRPGQARGVPDITPALPLFAQLRRFTLAVLAAAETAADFAGILYTDAPASGEADAAEPFEPIELEQRALLTMPGGWKMSQLHAEQPATSNLRCFQVVAGIARGATAVTLAITGRRRKIRHFRPPSFAAPVDRIVIRDLSGWHRYIRSSRFCLATLNVREDAAEIVIKSRT